jgi:hypothetical protein
MSCLSLPADELSRLQIIIKLQPTTLGQMSIRLQSQLLPDTSTTPAAPLKSSQNLSSMYAVNLQTEQDDDGQAILRVFTSLICRDAPRSDVDDLDSLVALSPPSITQAFTTQDPHTMVARPSSEPLNQFPQHITSSLRTNDDNMTYATSNISDELRTIPSDFSMSPFFEGNTYANTSSFDHSSAALSYSEQNISHGSGSTHPTSSTAFDCMSFFDFNTWPSADSPADQPNSISLPEHVTLRRATPTSPASSTSTLSPMSASFDSFDSSLDPDRDSSPSDSGKDTSPHRRFRCTKPGCDRRFTSQYTLKVHTEAHKVKPRVSLPCTLGCSERFSRRHDRLRHEVTQHGKVCEWVCGECGRFFSSEKTLGNHKCPTTKISFAPSRIPSAN